MDDETTPEDDFFALTTYYQRRRTAFMMSPDEKSAASLEQAKEELRAAARAFVIAEGRVEEGTRLGMERAVERARREHERAARAEREVVVLEKALRSVLDVCRDRQAFVLQGPRAFMRAEQVASEALDRLDESRDTGAVVTTRPPDPAGTMRIWCDDGCEPFLGPKDKATDFLRRTHRCPACDVVLDEPSIQVADGAGNWKSTCVDDVLKP